MQTKTNVSRPSIKKVNRIIAVETKIKLKRQKENILKQNYVKNSIASSLE